MSPANHTIRVRGLSVWVAVTVLGCHKDNRLYCGGYPDDPTCVGADEITQCG